MGPGATALPAARPTPTVARISHPKVQPAGEWTTGRGQSTAGNAPQKRSEALTHAAHDGPREPRVGERSQSPGPLTGRPGTGKRGDTAERQSRGAGRWGREMGWGQGCCGGDQNCWGRWVGAHLVPLNELWLKRQILRVPNLNPRGGRKRNHTSLIKPLQHLTAKSTQRTERRQYGPLGADSAPVPAIRQYPQAPHERSRELVGTGAQPAEAGGPCPSERH